MHDSTFPDISACLTRELQILPASDFTVPVEKDGQYHNVYVTLRPGLREFLKSVGTLYGVVIYTEALASVSDPVASWLADIQLTIISR